MKGLINVDLLNSEIFKSIMEFLILFIVVFIIYRVLYKRKKDFSKLKENDEIRIFVTKYDIDVRKIDYKKLLLVLSLINSFIIAFTATIIVRIESIMWSIVVCILIVIALIISLFTLAGNYFKSHEKEIVIEDKKTKKKEGKK